MGIFLNNDSVELYTDGSCKHNPGPGGWGVVLRWAEYEKTAYGSEKLTTNNRMELMAAIQGLSSLKKPCHVKLYTDSQYVMKGITEWMSGWKRKQWKNSSGQAVKNRDLWEQLNKLCILHEVQWFWVKGHAGNPGNEQADELANQGALEAQML